MSGVLVPDPNGAASSNTRGEPSPDIRPRESGSPLDTFGSVDGLAGSCCCAAKDEMVFGDGTLFGESTDNGRPRRGVGMEKVRASAESEGNAAMIDGEARPSGVGADKVSLFGGTGGVSDAEGVTGRGGGGGGWPSELSQASRASFSTELASGSNSERISLETGAVLAALN